MMQNCLGSQIGRNIQVYIDDVVITTREEESLISDLAETFDNLSRYKLKLNPIKCSFGVSAGQLLGFLVSARGIEANPEKIQAILTMGKSTKLHDVQKLTERIAALSRFVARLGEKALPFYALMKKSDDKFEWRKEADAAFAHLKKVLSMPSVLVAPKEKEPLLLYIAATHQVVSTVLVVKRGGEEEKHVVCSFAKLTLKVYHNFFPNKKKDVAATAVLLGNPLKVFLTNPTFSVVLPLNPLCVHCPSLVTLPVRPSCPPFGPHSSPR
jgi:hypothetical protein